MPHQGYYNLLCIQVRVGRGHARAYAYQHSLTMRNHDDHLMDAQNALDNGKVRPSYSRKYEHGVLLVQIYRQCLVLKGTPLFICSLHLISSSVFRWITCTAY